MSKKIKQPGNELHKKCKHQLYFSQCSVCKKEMETFVQYILKIFLTPPTPKELGNIIQKVAENNLSLSKPTFKNEEKNQKEING